MVINVDATWLSQTATIVGYLVMLVGGGFVVTSIWKAVKALKLQDREGLYPYFFFLKMF